MKIGIYKIRTDGLYGNGVGFLSAAKARAWEAFWAGLNARTERQAIMLRYAPPKPGDSGCGSLVTTGGGGYLHPEGICLLDRQIGSSNRDCLRDELERLFTEVCEECGCSYRIASKTVEVDDGDMEVLI